MKFLVKLDPVEFYKFKNTKLRKHMLNSRTHIDSANLYPDKLLISGWSYSCSGIPLDNFKITCQNYEFTSIKLNKFLSSLDVSINSGYN